MRGLLEGAGAVEKARFPEAFAAIHSAFNAFCLSTATERFAMRQYRTLLLSLCAAVAAPMLHAAPASAQGFHGPIHFAAQERDQERAFMAKKRGRSMPLPMIEHRVMPFMGGADYLGPEFRGDTYRLKFMRGGRVIWVDVDAATGRIVGKSGD